MSPSDRLPSLARRRFLRSTALGGLGLFVGTEAARAWTEQPMDVATHRLYADRCRLAGDGYHEQLAAEERTRLAGTMSADRIASALAAYRCPICGCPVVGSTTPVASAAKAG
ncbi:MAG TPA: hypothetical protein VGV37_12960 [Aliidongia sp.]|uniref:hypothetical protein n=1 Tax=Aliidongia sp. TaxID=1914230 RepID=UPI002DDCC28D|nr:hypothetical protein [Aliidongia sp.]HEV2675446.1 hypothetical protein [Aliidongia sp.]